MNDFGWGAGAQREPVADAVGDDEVAVAFRVMAGPVAKHEGAETGLGVQHQLAAMGVAGKGEGDLRGRRGIEGVGMVREKNRERLRVAEREQFGERGAMVASSFPSRRRKIGPAPALTEKLEGMTAHGELFGFIHQERECRNL